MPRFYRADGGGGNLIFCHGGKGDFRARFSRLFFPETIYSCAGNLKMDMEDRRADVGIRAAPAQLPAMRPLLHHVGRDISVWLPGDRFQDQAPPATGCVAKFRRILPGVRAAAARTRPGVNVIGRT